MVHRTVREIRPDASSLASKTMLLCHRLRAIGFYCEAGIEWELVDVSERHRSAMVIRSPRPSSADERFLMQGADNVCEAQIRFDDVPALHIIFESGLSYRVTSATGAKDNRVFHVLLALPPNAHNEAVVGNGDKSDAEWCEDVLRLHDKLVELETFRTTEPVGKSETLDASDKSGTSVSSKGQNNA